MSIINIILGVVTIGAPILFSIWCSRKHNGYSSLFFDEPEKISSVKTLSELKTTIDGLEKGSPEKEILDRHYNRLLSGNLENAAKKRYYELAKTLNPNNAPLLGYVSCFIFGASCIIHLFNCLWLFYKKRIRGIYRIAFFITSGCIFNHFFGQSSSISEESLE